MSLEPLQNTIHSRSWMAVASNCHLRTAARGSSSLHLKRKTDVVLTLANCEKDVGDVDAYDAASLIAASGTFCESMVIPEFYPVYVWGFTVNKKTAHICYSVRTPMLDTDKIATGADCLLFDK